MTWEDLLGGVGAGLESIFGTHTNTPPPVDHTKEILGMQKTVFYAVAGVGAIVLILVAYLLLRKK